MARLGLRFCCAQPLWMVWTPQRLQLLVSILLYVFVGCCWLPVIWMQIRMRRLAETAARADTSLPPRYHRYYRWWFRLGWAAFLGVLVIFYLMVAKPV